MIQAAKSPERSISILTLDRRSPIVGRPEPGREGSDEGGLTKELQAWRKRAESMRLKPDTQLAGTLGAEELERLRALGYVQ